MKHATLTLVILISASAHAAPRFWSVTPYSVRLVVAAEGPRWNHDATAKAFARDLAEQLNRGVRPLWQAETEFVAPAWARDIATAEPQLPPTDSDGSTPDKTIVVWLRETPDEILIIAREHDHALTRWGAIHRDTVARLADAAGAVVDSAVAAFAPLASFDLDPDAPGQVRLAYRGADLIDGGFGSVGAGEVLLPYWRRVDREGNPIPDGVRRVPWTYLVAEQAAEADTEIAARVYSHARAPFGARRRGRVEQLALHVRRNEGAPTVLRLHDRNNAAVALAGYEVFVSPPGSKELTRLGRSDSEGRLAVPPDPDGAPVRMTHIRCGSSVVASLPIAVGVEPVLETPLLDERKRLEAETKVAALREELVDLVARRRILAARIRKRLEQEDLETATELLDEVNGMPGFSQFNRRLDKAEQLFRADDPAAQRRLDRLFTETRSVLGSALDPRETRELANEVLEAQNAGG